MFGCIDFRKDFGVVIEDLEKKWDNQCWKCQTKENPEKLKTCSGTIQYNTIISNQR